MAKGFDQHQQRNRSLSAFGKDLARRARSRCELCETGGGPLVTFELPPVPSVPEFERCLMLCATCADELGQGKIVNPERWRCLNNTVWSETPSVQAAAVTILHRLSENTPWAGELLEQVFLSEESKHLLGEADLPEE